MRENCKKSFIVPMFKEKGDLQESGRTPPNSECFFYKKLHTFQILNLLNSKHFRIVDKISDTKFTILKGFAVFDTKRFGQ